MNGGFFYWVLNMSIAGTIVGGLILLVQKVLLQRVLRMPKRLSFVLWIIPLIRFWLPFGAESKYSLMNLIKQLTARPVQYYEIKQGEIKAAYSNYIQAAESYFPIRYKNDGFQVVFSGAELIWVIVAIAAVLASVALYLITRAEVKSAIYVRDNIYQSDKVTSPMVFGVIRPRILLPRLSEHFGFDDEPMNQSDFDSEQVSREGFDGDVKAPRIWIFDRKMDYVLLHEQTHIRRKDNLWRIAAVLTCCVHWFNPFIWLFLKQFFADMELACDEKVISLCGEEKKKEYASALLDWEEQRTVFAAAFGGAKIRVRIEKIISYRKLTVCSAVGFMVLAAAVAVALLTNAAG